MHIHLECDLISSSQVNIFLDRHDSMWIPHKVYMELAWMKFVDNLAMIDYLKYSYVNLLVTIDIIIYNAVKNRI